MLALSRKIIGSEPLAEEVVQEVFIRLWNDPRRFDADRGTLRSFLLAGAHSKSIDLIRSESARRAREEREAREILTRGDDFDREINELTTSEYVRDALAELGVGERQAIELAYFKGLTYREVAIVLKEPEGTVKSRIRSGLRRLSESLQEVEI